jgi:hypothetical protein
LGTNRKDDTVASLMNDPIASIVTRSRDSQEGGHTRFTKYGQRMFSGNGAMSAPPPPAMCELRMRKDHGRWQVAGETDMAQPRLEDADYLLPPRATMYVMS